VLLEQFFAVVSKSADFVDGFEVLNHKLFNDAVELLSDGRTQDIIEPILAFFRLGGSFEHLFGYVDPHYFVDSVMVVEDVLVIRTRTAANVENGLNLRDAGHHEGIDYSSSLPSFSDGLFKLFCLLKHLTFINELLQNLLIVKYTKRQPANLNSS
jgi:hypothetical protein